MMRRSSPIFDRILERVSAMPVIDCHEHMAGTDLVKGCTEPIALLVSQYYMQDMMSVGADRETRDLLRDPDIGTEGKWPTFETIWRKTEHTAYARQIKLIVQECFGEEGVSLPALLRIGKRLAARDPGSYMRMLDDARIALVISDALNPTPPGRTDLFERYLSGALRFPENWRLVIPLPLFHAIRVMEMGVGTWMGVQQIGAMVDRHVTSLDEFLECVFEVLKRAKERGAVGIKDQWAYIRSLDYEVTPRCDAERLFNRMLSDPRAMLPWPEAKPLDDFLFHQYMRFARDLDLPVQLHTGHMAINTHLRPPLLNRVDKANAAHFVRVMELHQDVRFDLFHGNWPYMGDLLFLAKNYPNAAIDCCWLYVLDPLYAKELLERAVVTVPHSKVHGFGGDHGDFTEMAVTHLKMAREVIASALANLVERGWLEEEQAVGIAAEWLFNNPNRFFKLGLEPIGTSGA